MRGGAVERKSAREYVLNQWQRLKGGSCAGVNLDALADKAGALPRLRRRALHVGVDDGLVDLRVEDDDDDEDERGGARGSSLRPTRVPTQANLNR